MYIPGRRFDVEIRWADISLPDYCETVLAAVMEIHRSTPVSQPCDILVFLTGKDGIDDGIMRLNNMVKGSGLKPIDGFPLYAALPSEKQTRVCLPAQPGCRKVTFAMSIAETSLTIDTVKYVVDYGIAKEISYNARTGCESLDIVPFSVSSLIQRAGRAGRFADGVSYRLYTRAAYEHEMPKSTKRI
jgi:HrpA-like RNA helicase